jgi:hypothetical protein
MVLQRNSLLALLFLFLPYVSTIRPLMAMIRPNFDAAASHISVSPSQFTHDYSEHSFLEDKRITKLIRISERCNVETARRNLINLITAHQTEGAHLFVSDSSNLRRMCLRGGSQARPILAPSNGALRSQTAQQEISESEHSSDHSAQSRCRTTHAPVQLRPLLNPTNPQVQHLADRHHSPAKLQVPGHPQERHRHRRRLQNAGPLRRRPCRPPAPPAARRHRRPQRNRRAPKRRRQPRRDVHPCRPGLTAE